jgi:serine phosphatase RsbU (regulator of sigma subunit)
METLKETIGQTPERIISRMRSSVREFTGNAEQSDDLTMLAVQYYVD